MRISNALASIWQSDSTPAASSDECPDKQTATAVTSATEVAAAATTTLCAIELHLPPMAIAHPTQWQTDCLSAYRTVCLPVCISAYWTLCLLIGLSVCLLDSLSGRLSVGLSVCLSKCLSVCRTLSTVACHRRKSTVLLFLLVDCFYCITFLLFGCLFPLSSVIPTARAATAAAASHLILLHPTLPVWQSVAFDLQLVQIHLRKCNVDSELAQ